MPDDRQVRDRVIKSLLAIVELLDEPAFARVNAAKALLDAIDDRVPPAAAQQRIAIGVGINIGDMRQRAAEAIAAAFAELPPAVETEEPPRSLLPGPPITDVDPGAGR